MQITGVKTVTYDELPRSVQEIIEQKRTNTLPKSENVDTVEFSDLTLKSVHDSDSQIHVIEDVDAYLHEQIKYILAFNASVKKEGNLDAGADTYEDILNRFTNEYANDEAAFKNAKEELDRQYEQFAEHIAYTMMGLTHLACGTGSLQDGSFKAQLTSSQIGQIHHDVKAYLMGRNALVETEEATQMNVFTEKELKNLTKLFFANDDEEDIYLNAFLKEVDANDKLSADFKEKLHDFVLPKYRYLKRQR